MSCNLNLLKDYICSSLPESGDFCTAPGLNLKLGPGGEFLDFRGNTLLFELDKEDKEFLAELQKELYEKAGFMLGEKLSAESFHMTLHDLENSGRGQEGLSERMRAAEQKSREILKIRGCFPEIRMKADWTFNMVNTSIVLGLEPADEGSGKLLSELYTEFERVTALGYSLCPHITLAYFKPGIYGRQELEALKKALHPVERNFTLRADKLKLKNFDNMNCYY